MLDEFKNKVHQDTQGELTLRGLDEAKLLGGRVASLEIDKILSSPILRAKHTAEIISDMSKVPFEVNDLLRELKKPTEIEGKAHSEPETIEIKQILRENYHRSDWHYSDEESFLDFKNRIDKLSKQLIERKSKNLLIVTHSAVIKMFVALSIYGDTLTSDLFLPMYDHLSIANTGISYFAYDREKGWRVNCFNDVSHISEYVAK